MRLEVLATGLKSGALEYCVLGGWKEVLEIAYHERC